MSSKTFGRTTSLLLLIFVITLTITPLLFVRGSAFGGADGAAREQISSIAPDYHPWFSPLMTPPGSETEGLLFALQAALGAGLIGYFFGLKHGLRRAAARGDQPEHEE